MAIADRGGMHLAHEGSISKSKTSLRMSERSFHERLWTGFQGGWAGLGDWVPFFGVSEFSFRRGELWGDYA